MTDERLTFIHNSQKKINNEVVKTIQDSLKRYTKKYGFNEIDMALWKSCDFNYIMIVELTLHGIKERIKAKEK